MACNDAKDDDRDNGQDSYRYAQSHADMPAVREPAAGSKAHFRVLGRGYKEIQRRLCGRRWRLIIPVAKVGHLAGL